MTMKKQLRIGIYILLATLLASVAVAQEPTTPALRSGQKGVITMTTSLKVGKEFNLTVKGSDISIVGAEKKTDSTYTITSQTIKIEGEVQSLKCPENMLTSLTLERCSSLTELNCRFNYDITSLDLSSCTALTKLYCSGKLTSLDLSHNTALKVLDCHGYDLTSLDLSHNTALTELSCYGLTVPLDLSHNTALTKLDCSGLAATSLDLSHNTALTELNCSYTHLSSLDLSHNKALKVFYSEEIGMTSLDFSHNTALEVLVAKESALKSLTLPKSKTLKVLDYTETKVGYIDVSNYPALEELWCEGNDLTHLDVSNNRCLKILACRWNKLTSLDLSNNPALEELYYAENPLPSLNVSNLPALTSLDCSKVQLTSLDLSNNPALEKLNCDGNQLTSLDLSNNPALKELYCYSNQLTSLDLSKQTALERVDCYENLLTKLELANCSNLTELNCSNNLLTKLEIPSSPNLNSIGCYGNLILANEMTNLVKALPDRNDKPSWRGRFNVFNSSSSDEKNVCYTYHVDIANAKGWNVIEQTGTLQSPYRGKPTPTYEVTLSANEEGGTILTAGAKDLKMVPYGTDLFVVDNPKEGYELTALTANETDILATKKVFITGHTLIKATFNKKPKTYKVTLKPTEHGTISIKEQEQVDLNAVPEGTKLTVVAQGANDKCELTKLTANGEDILMDMTFTVTKDTEVIAEFVDRTGIDAVAADALVIYPNPASESATVTGLAPETPVALYTLDGQLITRLATDRSGRLQIDLTALSEGTYLVVTEGAAQRLVVKH